MLCPSSRLSVFAVIGLALGLGANAAVAQDLGALREGEMRGLAVHADPMPVADGTFSDLDGGSHTLADFEGQVVLLNFWATWCAPCREEMPMLDALQQDLGGDDFQVVTLATGRNPPPAIRRFFDEEGIEALPTFIDPQQAIGRAMAVFGLPVTVIIDREGREIARLQGEADWSSPEARRLLEAVIAAGAGGQG
ncbi:MAG: TlpA disulfide reductase family protein [Pseudomonadota bacterium]